MLIENADDFYYFLKACAAIKQLSQDERRQQLEGLTSENLNEPYNIALLAICVTLPNRLSKGLTDIFDRVDRELRKVA